MTARFKQGDKVRILAANRPGHCRVPVYARGRSGTVERLCGDDEAKEDLVIEYGEAPMRIGFNAKYIQEVLTAMDSDQIDLELSDELSPGVVRPAGDKSYVAVIMPMRI